MRRNAGGVAECDHRRPLEVAKEGITIAPKANAPKQPTKDIEAMGMNRLEQDLNQFRNS